MNEYFNIIKLKSCLLNKQATETLNHEKLFLSNIEFG